MNLFTAATLRCCLNECAVTLAMATAFPAENTVKLVVTPERSLEFTLHLRIPAWAREVVVVEVNGRPSEIESWLAPRPRRPLHYVVQDRAAVECVPYWQVTSQTFTCFPIMGEMENRSSLSGVTARSEAGDRDHARPAIVC